MAFYTFNSELFAFLSDWYGMGDPRKSGDFVRFRLKNTWPLFSNGSIFWTKSVMTMAFLPGQLCTAKRYGQKTRDTYSQINMLLGPASSFIEKIQWTSTAAGPEDLKIKATSGNLDNLYMYCAALKRLSALVLGLNGEYYTIESQYAGTGKLLEISSAGYDTNINAKYNKTLAILLPYNAEKHRVAVVAHKEDAEIAKQQALAAEAAANAAKLKAEQEKAENEAAGYRAIRYAAIGIVVVAVIMIIIRIVKHRKGGKK